MRNNFLPAFLLLIALFCLTTACWRYFSGHSTKSLAVSPSSSSTTGRNIASQTPSQVFSNNTKASAQQIPTELPMKVVANNRHETPPAARSSSASGEVEAAVIEMPASTTSHEGRHASVSVEISHMTTRTQGTESSNGNESDLISSMSPYLFFKWTQVWSDKLMSFLGMGFGTIKVQPAAGFSFENSDQTTTAMVAGVDYVAAEDWVVHGTAGVGDQVFYRSTTPTVISFNKAMVPQIGVGVTYRLLRASPFDFSIRADAQQLMAAKVDTTEVKAGQSYRVTAMIKQDISHPWLKYLGGKIFYEELSQNSNYISKKNKNIGATLDLTWEFGK